MPGSEQLHKRFMVLLGLSVEEELQRPNDVGALGGPRRSGGLELAGRRALAGLRSAVGGA